MSTELYLYDQENGDTGGQPVGSQNPLPVYTPGAAPGSTTIVDVLKNAQLTVSSAAILLSTISGGIPANAIAAQCFVESNPIRMTEDGATTPTTTVGSPYGAGSTFTIWTKKNMGFAKMIRSGASDATVTVEFLGPGSFV